MDTIEISNDEEELVVLPASKTSTSEEILEVSQILGNGHFIIHCFSQHLKIVKSPILQEVWEESDHHKGKYFSFSSYELEEELMKALVEYLFGKIYGHEVVDLLIDCLSTIYQLRVFIFEESLDSIPMGTIGEDYEKEIYLLKTSDHYSLIKKKLQIQSSHNVLLINKEG